MQAWCSGCRRGIQGLLFHMFSHIRPKPIVWPLVASFTFSEVCRGCSRVLDITMRMSQPVLSAYSRPLQEVSRQTHSAEQVRATWPAQHHFSSLRRAAHGFHPARAPLNAKNLPCHLMLLSEQHSGELFSGLSKVARLQNPRIKMS